MINRLFRMEPNLRKQNGTIKKKNAIRDFIWVAQLQVIDAEIRRGYSTHLAQ